MLVYGAGAGTEAAWSRHFLLGAGADPSRSESEPESAPGPWPPGAGAGAAQKSGGSATLLICVLRMSFSRVTIRSALVCQCCRSGQYLLETQTVKRN